MDRCLRIGVLLAAIAVGVTTLVQAQEMGPLSSAGLNDLSEKSARKSGKVTAVAPALDCDYYYFTAPHRLAYADPRYAQIAACAKQLKEAISVAFALDPSPDLNDELIKLRVNYKTIWAWVKSKRPRCLPSTQVDDSDRTPCKANERELMPGDVKGWVDTRKELNEIGVLLPRLLKKHDLFAQFSAVLITGASLTDAGQPEPPAPAEAGTEQEESGGETVAAESPSQDPTGVGWVIFQSRHFGDESLRPIDISVGGRVGFQPVLNLVAPKEDSGDQVDTSQSLTAVHQSAFVWNFAVQANRQLRGINGEVGFFVKGGTSTLMSTPKAIDKGGDSFIAFPLDGGANATAWLWDTGFEFNMFDTRLEQMHAEKGGTSPQFQLMLALRRDERFRGSGFEDYERSAGRLVFRLALDAIKVFDKRQVGEVAKPFTFGFVVEHERSLASSGLRVPSATRFMLRGDINLLRAITGAATEAGGEGEGGKEGDHGDDGTKITVDLSKATVADQKLVLDSKSLGVSIVETVRSGASTPVGKLAVDKIESGKPLTLAVPGCKDSVKLRVSLGEKKLSFEKVDWDECVVDSVIMKLTTK